MGPKRHKECFVELVLQLLTEVYRHMVPKLENPAFHVSSQWYLILDWWELSIVELPALQLGCPFQRLRECAELPSGLLEAHLGTFVAVPAGQGSLPYVLAGQIVIAGRL